MNSVVVFQEEVVGDTANLSGERVRYFHEFHSGKKGDSIPASVYGGQRGRALVVECEPERVILKLEFDQLEVLPRELVTLIVAVPRPQSIKRVLQFSTLMGVSRVVFVKADNVQASYMSSRELEPARSQLEMTKALEQCYDSVPPEVLKSYSLHSLLSSLPSSRRLLAHTAPTARSLASIGSIEADEEIVLAVGCEAGWSDREVGLFEAFDFIPVSLGERVLRVDSAVAVLLSQIKLLRELAALNA